MTGVLVKGLILGEGGTLSWEDIGEIYEASVAVKSFGVTFYDWPRRERSACEFKWLATRRFPAFVGVKYKGRWALYSYITEWEGRAARVHFGTCLPPREIGQDGALLAEAIAALFDHFTVRPDGTEADLPLQTLWMAIPAINQGAIRYAVAAGGRPAGTLPGLCYFGDSGQTHTGQIIVFERCKQ